MKICIEYLSENYALTKKIKRQKLYEDRWRITLNKDLEMQVINSCKIIG